MYAQIPVGGAAPDVSAPDGEEQGSADRNVSGERRAWNPEDIEANLDDDENVLMCMRMRVHA